MLDNNLIKNITSKDANISKNTILKMIKNSSVEDFEQLSKKCDFIFPFLKERIIKDFINLIDKENLKSVFEFSKIYCADFEDLIVKSWLKFASEDLTDEILELFENGTDEQKAYCALYFKYIQDSLALEFLNRYSYSEFEPLKINCARTLSEFKDKKVYNEMKDIVLKSNDDFEKNSAFLFICAYGSEDSIAFTIENYFNNPFKIQIISNLLDYNSFDKLKNLKQDKIIQIFSTLIEGYPEDIDLSSVGYYGIIDFIKLINSYNTQYAKNSLILAREKFKEFFENDIYLFDLDKNSKADLKDVYNYLINTKLDTPCLSEELNHYNTHQYDLALDVIRELKLKDYSNLLAKNLNNLNETFIAKSVVILKELDAIDLVSETVLKNIQNVNIKALVQSYI